MSPDLISTLVAAFQLIEMAKMYASAVNASGFASRNLSYMNKLQEHELDGSSFGVVPDMKSILDDQMSAHHFGCVGAAM